MQKPTKLSVNLNAVAYLRNRRNLSYPSVVGTARIVLDAGADGITVHPRPDERHIRRADVEELAALLARHYPGAEFNIEGFPTPEFMALVERVRPHQVTLVPDHPEQQTSDHGWEIEENHALLAGAIGRLKAAGIRASLFIDSDPAMTARAKHVGAERVELYTGPYGSAEDSARQRLLSSLAKTSAAAARVGLGVNAGHDLSLANLPAFLAQVPGVAEVSIGHAITADALLYGFAAAVRRYQATLGAPRTSIQL